MDDRSLLLLLPEDLRIAIFDQCSIKDIVNASRVCKSWNVAIDSSQRLWDHLIHRDFSNNILEASIHDSQNSSKAIYQRLATKHTCTRCMKHFIDGNNTPSSCNFHPGILFSGGLMNGSGLRFICCNRRAHHILIGNNRDSNGCKSSYHVAANDSLWAPEGSLNAVLRSTVVSSNSEKKAHIDASSRYHSSNNNSQMKHHPLTVAQYTHQPIVWDPTQRPGLIELPSRLLLAA